MPTAPATDAADAETSPDKVGSTICGRAVAIDADPVGRGGPRPMSSIAIVDEVRGRGDRPKPADARSRRVARTAEPPTRSADVATIAPRRHGCRSADCAPGDRRRDRRSRRPVDAAAADPGDLDRRRRPRPTRCTSRAASTAATLGDGRSCSSRTTSSPTRVARGIRPRPAPRIEPRMRERRLAVKPRRGPQAAEVVWSCGRSCS